MNNLYIYFTLGLNTFNSNIAIFFKLILIYVFFYMLTRLYTQNIKSDDLSN